MNRKAFKCKCNTIKKKYRKYMLVIALIGSIITDTYLQNNEFIQEFK